MLEQFFDHSAFLFHLSLDSSCGKEIKRRTTDKIITVGTWRELIPCHHKFCCHPEPAFNQQQTQLALINKYGATGMWHMMQVRNILKILAYLVIQLV